MPSGSATPGSWADYAGFFFGWSRVPLHMLKRRILTSLLLALPLGFSGCSTSTISIDPGLASRTEPMLVLRSSFLWREGLSFGPFHVRLSSGIPWASVSGDLAKAGLAWQSHRFELNDGAASLHATCRTRSRASWTIANPQGMPRVRCAFRSIAGEEPWTLIIRQTGPRRFGGSLKRDDGAAEMGIQSAHRSEGAGAGLGNPIGYTVTREGVVVAAVDTRNTGRVWIDPALSGGDRVRAATAAASLLLFDPADDE